jgi:hypothetical protein
MLKVIRMIIITKVDLSFLTVVNSSQLEDPLLEVTVRKNFEVLVAQKEDWEVELDSFLEIVKDYLYLQDSNC